jgi:hypothetical protein
MQVSFQHYIKVFSIIPLRKTLPRLTHTTATTDVVPAKSSLALFRPMLAKRPFKLFLPIGSPTPQKMPLIPSIRSTLILVANPIPLYPPSIEAALCPLPIFLHASLRHRVRASPARLCRSRRFPIYARMLILGKYGSLQCSAYVYPKINVVLQINVPLLHSVSWHCRSDRAASCFFDPMVSNTHSQIYLNPIDLNQGGCLGLGGRFCPRTRLSFSLGSALCHSPSSSHG